eukprot:GILK01007843.1.p1 GENE.GILK01007843.1~~GILK01007843.1.p1  ORF type:complete len:432 (-),score=86.92 GILK01007843.1:203-1498(-)
METNMTTQLQQVSALVSRRGRVVSPSHAEDTAVDEVYPEPVLLNNSLKFDHFSGINLLHAQPAIIDGVYNFRRIDRMPLFGVFQPTIAGIEHVLIYLQSVGHKQVVWANMREEPVVFVSGKPMAPRLPGRLDENIDYLLSIEEGELESMERRLQQDVQEHVKQTNGDFHYYHQNDTMQNVELSMQVTEEDVKTLRDVYDSLFKQGYDVTYKRIPIQDECAPELKDFDDLVSILAFADPSVAFVFNCQMGRGRTTTALVVAALIWRVQHPDAFGTGLNYSSEDNSNAALVKRRSTLQRAPSFLDVQEYTAEEKMKNYLAGKYQVINDLVETLAGGEIVKEMVDRAIDESSALQNLRTTIYDCKKNAEKCVDDVAKATFWLKRGLNFLERYWYLIVFGAYVVCESPSGFNISFTKWMRKRWSLRRMLSKLSLE